ncbi:DUF2332 family protein [Bradyrhizobium sp.]|uniref:DUF2332 family protein n=1 Tax=Bradyrhizobium sp. TaxID=376 RepID=UPI003444EA59
MHNQDFADLSNRYRRFAEVEAHDRSPLYAALARGVAQDREAPGFLMPLPKEKQQPNLLIAAVRHLFGVSSDWQQLRDVLLANTDAIRSIMLTRSTQTNEPARCAVLRPVLAQLPKPLALIEVGASAGLCLLPDLYGYDYGSRRRAPGPLLSLSGASRSGPRPPAGPGTSEGERRPSNMLRTLSGTTLRTISATRSRKVIPRRSA